MNVDETYDLLLERELGPAATERLHPDGAEALVVEAGTDDAVAAGESGRVAGFGRYRNAALVGAGGLACAAVGALLGGLGGSFTVAPATAHVVGASAQDTPLADAINGAARSGLEGRGQSAGRVTTLAAMEGSLTNGISVFSLLSAGPAVTSAAGTSGLGLVGSGRAGVAGAGSGALGGAGVGCISGGADLTSLIDSVACTLGSVGSLAGGGGSGVLPSLGGLTSDVTGTLSSLGVPGSLPTPTGLSLPGGSGGSGSLPVPSGDSLTGILNAVTDGVTKGGGSSLPLPTSGSAPTLPSLPVTTPTLPSVPSAPSVTSSGGSTTASVPTPSLPVPVGATITVGGVSVGVNTGGSSPGATLNLP